MTEIETTTKTAHTETTNTAHTETTKTASSSKVVPLSKNELILGGVCGLIIVTTGFVFEIWVDATIGFDHSQIKTASDLDVFGEYISSTRPYESFQLGVFIFIYPIFVWWYSAMMRVLKICFAEYHGCRTMFSFSYFLFAIFLYLQAAVGILWQAFFWSIIDEETDMELPSTNLILLFMYRFQILLASLGIYFSAIMGIAFWLPFIYACYIDINYKNNLKAYIIPACCNGWCGKIFVVLLTIFTLIGSYLSVYAWSYNGFWSLSGGSQIFQLFTIFSGTLSAVWLIWFALSVNYNKFNDRVEFQQFL